MQRFVCEEFFNESSFSMKVKFSMQAILQCEKISMQASFSMKAIFQCK